MCTINQDHMMYGSWDIKCKGQSFLSFWAIFLPFDPPNKPKNQNPKKCLEILSFYTCVLQMTIMMYGSWYIKHDRQNFLSFWVIFGKLKKAPEDIIILHKCTINDNHMIYGSWDINCNRQIFFVILGHFLPFYPPNSPKKENIKKMKKLPGNIILHKWTKNHEWS